MNAAFSKLAAKADAAAGALGSPIVTKGRGGQQTMQVNVQIDERWTKGITSFLFAILKRCVSRYRCFLIGFTFLVNHFVAMARKL